MLNTFENKIAVITGAANGIGAALADPGEHAGIEKFKIMVRWTAERVA